MKSARRALFMLGTLTLMLAFQNCEFLGGPIGSAIRTLASGSSLPNGVYGISPLALQLKDSRRGSFSNLVVRSSGSGADGILSTNFNTGKITGLRANTTYYLDVRGISGSTGQIETPLANYSVTTWDTFANANWAITTDATSSNQLPLTGSSNAITWSYAPWTITPAGDGVLDNTWVQCFFVPDQGPNTNPFVASAKMVQGLAVGGNLPFTAADVGLSGNVRMGCQMVYADKTVSLSNLRRQTLLLPAVGRCPGAEMDVYQTFTCTVADVAGATSDSASMTFKLDPTNTCSWITIENNVLKGIPRDPAVGSCNLAFTLNSGGAASPVIKQVLTVNNAKPVWVRTPNTPAPLRETSRNDPGAVNGSSLDLAKLRSNSAYVLHMVDQFQTNKAAYGTVDGASYGSYKIDATTASNCSRLGSLSYLDASGNYAAGINPATGEFWFQPFEYVWGSCTIDVYFDDGHLVSNRSDLLSIPIKIQGFNDPPVIVDPNFPMTGFAGAELYDCGSNCYVNIDYTLTLQATTGGINADHPDISGESDQTLMMKPGNCIAINSDPADGTPYVAINYCQLDPKTGNILIGFQPLAVPPTGTFVTIKIVASDNGARGPAMASAFNPNTAGTNKLCLSADKSVCAEFPNSNADSNPFAFSLKINSFNLPLNPALIVSKGACLSCHLVLERGDLITDLGNTPPGTVKGGRFTNKFFTDAGLFDNEANHIDGFRAMDQLNGNMYVKRAAMNPVANPAFMNRVSNVPLVGGQMDLVTFLTTSDWKIDGARYTSGWQTQPNSFASVCNPTCASAPVRDTIDRGGQTLPINYLTISAPTASDIQQIARTSAGSANQINWTSGAAGFGALYLQPTDPSVPPRPFSGLVISNKQPNSARLGQPAKNALQSYVTNSGVIQCYGDVVVKGDLFLDTPSFASDSRGCRIHVSGSVLMFTRAASSGEAVAGDTISGAGNVGVQITSAVAIGIGFSQTELEMRGMPEATRTFAANIYLPYTTDCLSGSTFVRFADTVNRVCPSGTAPPTDETEMPAGYQGWSWGHASYTGLMLNAPNVQSRYQGEIVGSIIADYALFRLGALKFKFDDRFADQVPFPRLQTIKSALGNNPRVIFDAGTCTGTNADSWQCDAKAVQ